MSETLNPRARAIRQIIQNFINDRFVQRVARYEPGSEPYEQERQNHEYLTWLELRVKRSTFLQVVTHPLKATYSDINIKNADSLFCMPEALSDHGLAATASLKDKVYLDVTGNAAALDIYRLLLQEYEGQALLMLCINKDPDMQAALHPDPEIAQEWINTLAELAQPKTEQPSSHAMAKQVYWFTGNDPYDDSQYILIQPLFSSPVAQYVYETIQEDKFGEEAKQAKEARRKNEPSELTYRVYSDLAVQGLGGGNPQNVSYFNTLRRGGNYLLSSCPPLWRSSGLRPILFRDNAFERFAWKSSARWGWDAHYWLKQLKDFLQTGPAPVLETRERVGRLINGLIDELLVFTHIHHELPAGWSAAAECYLPIAQKYWLDPDRVFLDEEFAMQCAGLDWQAEIEKYFAQWVNHELGQYIDFLGAVEFRRWAKELRRNNRWRLDGTQSERKNSQQASI